MPIPFNYLLVNPPEGLSFSLFLSLFITTYIWHIDGTQSASTTLVQSGTEYNGHQELFQIP